jgi:hypothetical protein
MKLADIMNEDDLRTWLREQAPIIIDVSLQWVEPAMYGSSVGCADVILKHKREKVDVELKYLECMKKGIKFTLRPSQRRFHHMSMRRGHKTSLLAVANIFNKNVMFLMRGYHIPLRDYASDPSSGCADGIIIRRILNEKADVLAISQLKSVLFNDLSYWEEKS